MTLIDTINTIGAKSANFTFYLANPPIIACATNADVNVAQLIVDNGNHWRKILTIMAKLCCCHIDWKSYRDQQLLQHHERICFTDELLDHGGWHIVCGQANWQRIGIDPQSMKAVDDKARVWATDKLLLTPYLDYRQFPNALIESVVEYINR